MKKLLLTLFIGAFISGSQAAPKPTKMVDDAGNTTTIVDYVAENGGGVPADGASVTNFSMNGYTELDGELWTSGDLFMEPGKDVLVNDAPYYFKAADAGTAAFLDEADIPSINTNTYLISGLNSTDAVRELAVDEAYTSVPCPFYYAVGAAGAQVTELSTSLYSHKFTASNQRLLYGYPKNAEEIHVRLYFEQAGAAATNGCRLSVYAAGTTDAGVYFQQLITDYGISSTNIFYDIVLDINYPSIPTFGDDATQIMIYTSTPSANGVSVFQPFYVLAVDAKMPSETAKVVGTLLMDSQAAPYGWAE